MDTPTEAGDLRAWLRELKASSGLSYAAIAQAIGEEERNVKRWMRADGKPTIPAGDVVLRLVSALGVTLNPPGPRPAQAVNAKVEELRSLLEETNSLLESARFEAARERSSIGTRLETLEDQGKAVTEILEGLVDRVEQRLAERAAGDVKGNRGASR